MDPNATLQAIGQALRDGDTAEAAFRAEDLVAWLDSDGCSPADCAPGEAWHFCKLLLDLFYSNRFA